MIGDRLFSPALKRVTVEAIRAKEECGYTLIVWPSEAAVILSEAGGSPVPASSRPISVWLSFDSYDRNGYETLSRFKLMQSGGSEHLCIWIDVNASDRAILF
jgi:hypothetical protein